MILPVVISFFDYTGHAVREWAAAGHECHCYDSQHPKDGRVELIGCGSAWKKDPVSGVIGVEQGPLIPMV